MSTVPPTHPQRPDAPFSDYQSLVPSNRSSYSLATVADTSSPTPGTSLLAHSEPSYGSIQPSQPSNRRLIWNAALKMAVIFFVSTALLGGTLWLALPTLQEQDRPMLKIPKSFDELKNLNVLLKKYRDIYPYRIVVCYVITYFFLQAFSLPGSMYLSILGGAVWGVPRALPLACACVATGATLCYLISAALGPALLTMPRWKSKLDVWADKLRAHRDDIISFLIVLRIAPLPPHWVVNVVCPHVGIGIVPFWISTFLGIFGVTVIHTTIGGSLDEMTSPEDFHLISWRNFFGLSAVVVGVMIPVGLRYYLRRQVAAVADVEVDAEAADDGAGPSEDRILEEGPRANVAKGKDAPLILFSDDDSELGSDEDSDEDVILEAGPALIIKPDESRSLPGERARR
ncbi:oxalate transporter [Epithele typhae]|uniref:oxalate transporter n=1 Tax=Epithele typhae TaxID=378194 RepID=UPI002007C60F|nr:oxalate transporter [Epithele typhae]KAH9945482.1 oxalate transporter [Epithele typhae]